MIKSNKLNFITTLFIIGSFFMPSLAFSSEDLTNPHAEQIPSKFRQFLAPAADSSPLYFSMEKNVVNFKGEGKAKFLAVDLKFLSYFPEVVGETGWMENLRPVLRNNIDKLLRKQSFTELNQPKATQHLRLQILGVARETLEAYHIFPNLIKDVYLTKFVMQ